MTCDKLRQKNFNYKSSYFENFFGTNFVQAWYKLSNIDSVFFLQVLFETDLHMTQKLN